MKAGWLKEHETSAEEINDLIQIADRDLTDCEAGGLSADWKLNIAYNAALQAATAALAACGYRASREAHHYRVIQSLIYTVGTDKKIVQQFDKFRKKRNIGGYERAGIVSDQEADDMKLLGNKLRNEVVDWLRTNYPEYLI
jgi:hypothetical protein